MKKLSLLYFMAILAVASCNNSSSTSSGSTDTTSNKIPTVSAEATPAANANGDAAAVSFMLNGSPAITVAAGAGDDKHSAMYGESNKVAHITLLGYGAPDTYRHGLIIQVKDFPMATGVINNATAIFARRDTDKTEYQYEQIKEGSFKLTITKFEKAAEKSAGRQYAMISGSFEGDLDCSFCKQMNKTTGPLAGTQHITGGKFENVKMYIMK